MTPYEPHEHFEHGIWFNLWAMFNVHERSSTTLLVGSRGRAGAECSQNYVHEGASDLPLRESLMLKRTHIKLNELGLMDLETWMIDSTAVRAFFQATLLIALIPCASP